LKVPGAGKKLAHVNAGQPVSPHGPPSSVATSVLMTEAQFPLRDASHHK
jgi:hypothetical protein